MSGNNSYPRNAGIMFIHLPISLCYLYTPEKQKYEKKMKEEIITKINTSFFKILFAFTFVST
jgi:hypothetical protein